MSNRAKYELLDFAARVCAVLPPLIATFYFFPEWVQKSPSATFSGTALVVCLICMIPFWKKIFEVGKNFTSASMPIFWLVLFAVVMVLKEIVDKFVIISLLGFCGSLLSISICFFRNKYKPSESTTDGEENK
jgi:O-antigen/teichoic acid export membrane protein